MRRKSGSRLRLNPNARLHRLEKPLLRHYCDGEEHLMTARELQELHLLRLVRAFVKIKDEILRLRIIEFVEAAADGHPETE
jgi:hypothetical protein